MSSNQPFQSDQQVRETEFDISVKLTTPQVAMLLDCLTEGHFAAMADLNTHIDAGNAAQARECTRKITLIDQVKAAVSRSIAENPGTF